MRILFITPRFPYPPLKGDKIRAYYPIKLLSEEHQIDLLAFSEEKVKPEYIDEMKKYCSSIKIVPLHKVFFYGMLALGVMTPWPSQVLCYQSVRMKKYINNYIHNNKYDVIHIVSGRLAGYGNYVNSVPKIIDWIDALSLSTERMYRTEHALIKKFLYRMEWKKMQMYEKKNFTACNYSFITSQVDKDYLGNPSTEVIPNGVDTNIFHPIKRDKDVDIIFTGNMGYFPNIKAVQFFCEEVLPFIIQKRPETRFLVAGINPARSVLKYHDNENVIVTGYVENLSYLINGSKVFVAPLQSGAGIQNKILEAMACSLPVVSTSYGNAGIKAKEGQEIIIKNNALDFANAILDLLDNVSRRNIIGKNGHELVKKNFGWELMVGRINELYSNCLKKSIAHKRNLQQWNSQ